MLNFILLLTLIFIFYILFHISGFLRESILKAFLCFSTLIVFSSELISFFLELNFTFILIFWLSTVTLLFFGVWRLPKKMETLKKVSQNTTKIFSSYNFFIIPIIFILVITLIIALVSPVNNTDSLTYHLSRVMYWIQSGHLNHFATNNFRQVAFNIFSELVILHIVVLGKTDFAVNLVQWGSFLGVIITCSLVVKKLGGTLKEQFMGSFIAATIPMTILQSTSTQNDLTVSFFVISGAYFLLNYLEENRWEDIIFFSISLGLAELTKGTGYIFFFPFCIWLGVHIVSQKEAWKKINTLSKLMIVLTISLSFNIGYYWRNWLIFNDIFGHSSDGMSLGNHSWEALTSNILRNISLHVGIQSPYDYWNEFLMSTLLTIHQALEIDIADPLTTFGITPIFKIPRFNMSEDFAGNFLHFFLFTIISFLYLFNSNKKRTVSIFWLCSISGFVLFSSLLRYQLFGSRLHSPFFILISCFIAVVIGEKSSLNKVIVYILSIGSLPFLFLNFQKPLISFKGISKIIEKQKIVTIDKKTLALYQKKSILEVSYRDVISHEGLDEKAVAFLNVNDFLSKSPIKSIGLELSGDDKDYIILREQIPNQVEVRRISTDGVLKKLEDPSFLPKIIVSSRRNKDLIVYNYRLYKKIKSEDYLNVYQITNIITH